MFSKNVIAKVTLGILSVVMVIHANATTFNSCPENFYKGKAPEITKVSLDKNTYSFCYKGFATKYSGVSKTGLWSAHYLTPKRIQDGKSVQREDNFHEETRVKKEHRALLSDYRGSGFDRGHLSPSADQGTRSQQSDSFNLSNMIPQAPQNNQKVWNNIEQAVRTTVTKNKSSAYVITGGMFLGERVRKVGTMLAPSHVYKVVYFPKQDIVGAYVAVNDNSGRVDSVSLAQLEQYAGIDFLPALTRSSRVRYNLPLTANQAYKTKTISAMSSNQSTIFEQMPDANRGFQEVQNIGDGLSKEVIKDKLIELGVDVLKKTLK